MSRMRTSSASFSWARAAIRRACASESKLGLSVEAPLADERRHIRWDQLVDRAAGADRSRRRRIRLDLEESHPLRPLQALEHAFEPLPRKPGTRADAELGEIE